MDDIKKAEALLPPFFSSNFNYTNKMKKHSSIIIRERFFNILLALFYVYFAYSHAVYFFKTGSLPTFIFLVYESLIVFLVLLRKAPKEVSFDFKGWLAASIGTFLPIAFTSELHEFSGSLAVLAIQLIGVTISLIGMCSLNLSFGIVPANRGVKKAGMYKFVRHPIYAGYFISLTCFVIQNAGTQESLIRNAIILFITLTALIYRIKFEETFLSKDAEYKKLMKTTPYRLIPKVW